MPKIVDHDEVRAELLGRAFTAFATHGYAALSMRSLARSLNASTGTLYHYFESKQALFTQMIQRTAVEDAKLALDAIPAQGTAADMIDAVVDYLTNRDLHLRQLIRMGLEYQRAEPQERDTIRLALAAFMAVVDQRLPHFDPVMLMRTVVGALVLRDFDPIAISLESLHDQLQLQVRA